MWGMDWIDQVQEIRRWWARVSMIMNLRIPYNEGIFLTSCETGNFSRRTLVLGVSKLVSN